MQQRCSRIVCHMEQGHEDAEWVTVDELARARGVTVRNLRAYQARGLLPPPEVRARTGYYGPEHRARLALVQDLQGEGVRLETVKRLLDATGGGSAQVLHFLRTVRELFAEPEGEVLAAGELAAQFGTDDPKLLRRARDLGLLREVAPGQHQVVSPRLVAAGRSLVELGVPAARSLDVVARLRRHAEGIARLYVEVFLEQVWQPFDAAGRPDEQWPRVLAALDRLRTTGNEALEAVLEAAVGERLGTAFAKEITRHVRAAPDRPGA